MEMLKIFRNMGPRQFTALAQLTIFPDGRDKSDDRLIH